MLETVVLLFSAMLVWLLVIGMICFNAGMVRAKNAITIFVKSIVAVAISIIFYISLGHDIIFNYPTQNIIWHYFLVIFSNGTQQAAADTGAATLSLIMFAQMLLPAVALCIVIGASAERLKLWALILFAVIYVVFIYPVAAHWLWGGGFLQKYGVIDLGGSAVIFLSGATAGLTACLLLGPRKNRYDDNNEKRIIRSSNLPLATLGALFIWVGFFALATLTFLSHQPSVSAAAIAQSLLNISCSGACSLIIALLLTRFFYGLSDISLVMNGLFGGLVAIIASPITPSLGLALAIGAVSGILVIITVAVIDKLHIDDPFGAVASYGITSIWGLISVVLSLPYNQALSQLSIQLLGIAVIIAWVGATSLIIWLCLKYLIGIRISDAGEDRGLDITDCGTRAYPEFTISAK